MSLIDRLESKAAVDTRQNRVAAIFSDPDVDEAYKAELFVAMFDKRFSSPMIHAELRSDGFDVGLSSLKGFRRDLRKLVEAKLEAQRHE